MKFKCVLIVIFLFKLTITQNFKSNEICDKKLKCEGEDCSLLNCTGLLNFDCDRYECSLNAKTCAEYKAVRDEIISKKNSKPNSAHTIGMIHGISVVSKRLKKFEFRIKQVKPCES
jgi:hypothetical protein